MWWVGGTAALLLIAAIGILLVLRSGHRDAVIAYGIGIAVMLPFSIVILIVSMLATSALGGGTDFGALHTAILKIVCLLIAVNLVTLLPFGVILVFPVWLFGLMYLFGLDFWEARILIAINWVLNSLIKTFVLAMVLTLLLHGKGGKLLDMTDGGPEARATMSESEKALDAIARLGGEVEHPPGDDDDQPVIGVNLAGTQVTDAQLAMLKHFPQLRKLDLSRTRITDAGIAHLKGLATLQQIVLTGTQVTEQGVAELRQALPRAEVVR